MHDVANPTNLVRSIAEVWPADQWRDVNVVVAVSGGRDSVALLCALRQMQPTMEGMLSTAHLNHGLRGEHSDADEQFMRQLCEDLSVPLDVERIDLAADESAGDGIEAAARAARYEFLRRVARKRGARYVATAHTADDQAETILHRILRGTGLAGLAGMSLTRPLDASVTLVRPLLHVRRSDIDRFVAEQQQPFREDASNLDLRFTRNRIRHDLLPKLRREYNPAVDEALLRLGSLAGECRRAIDEIVGPLAAQHVRPAESAVTIDCRELADCSPYLVRQLLLHAWRDSGFPMQGMGKEEWDALGDMAVWANPTPRDFPGGIRAEKNGEQLVLTRR